MARAQLQAQALETYVVGADGTWFTARGGRRIGLTRKWILRTILRVLVQARVEAPGHGLSTQELMAQVWVDSPIKRRHLRNRLHVSLNGLRRLGLQELLVRRGDGYLLLPGACEVVPTEAARV